MYEPLKIARAEIQHVTIQLSKRHQQLSGVPVGSIRCKSVPGQTRRSIQSADQIYCRKHGGDRKNKRLKSIPGSTLSNFEELTTPVRTQFVFVDFHKSIFVGLVEYLTVRK